MRKIILFIVINLFLLTAYSQTERPKFLNKVNQHSISAELFALSYSYVHKFKTNVTFGVRIQAGYGLQFMLTSTSILFDYGYGNGPEKVTPSGTSIELLKIQLFYRYAISNSFYFDVGPVASIVTFGEAEWENPYCIGIEASAHYIFWKMHLGIRLKGALSFDTGNPEGINSDNSYYALYATPFVIGFNF